MVLDLLLPPLPKTLTLKPTLPPKNPPNFSIAVLFLERTPNYAPENPFREPIPKETEEEYKCLLTKVTNGLRAPFGHNNKGPLLFNGKKVGVDLSLKAFNAAVVIVLAMVEDGYYPAQDPTPLSPKDWARFACSLVTAIGQGYHCQNFYGNESKLKKA